jgi:DNA-binding CsgD family transcriptional regulator
LVRGLGMAWYEAAGRLIEAIGSPHLPKALADGLREIVPYEFTVIFGYVGSAMPLALFDDFPADRRRLHVEEYQAGPYLLDPFYLASHDPFAPGLWRLREIAPDRFYQGEYYRNYYAQTGLAEEVGYLIEANRQLRIVVSLMRKEKRFTTAEIRALREIWPIVEAVARKHWQDVAPDEASQAPMIEGRIEEAFRSIGHGVLTPREREVVELTLRGHSADAIGRLLGISPGTVRIHRRNIYAKLRISSQGELFSTFIAAMLESRLLDGHSFGDQSDTIGQRPGTDRPPRGAPDLPRLSGRALETRPQLECD